jgi:hypothetical protein
VSGGARTAGPASGRTTNEAEAPWGTEGAAYLAQLRKQGKPIKISINGQMEITVEDEGSFCLLVELVDRLETIEAIRCGMEEIETGRRLPAEEVFDELRKKYNIPRDQ